MDIGIIGGADGPRVIFLTSNFSWLNLSFIAIICIVIFGIVFRILRKKKNRY